MKKIGLVLLIGFMGCTSSPALMSRSQYDAVRIGEPVAVIEGKIGKPSRIHTKGSGDEEYEYIERVDMGMETVEERHYFLEIQEGVVTAKRMVIGTPPAYDEIYDPDPNDVELQ